MEYTKEQYEELINNSPLFDIDKERDGARYRAVTLKLINNVRQYYQELIWDVGKKLWERRNADEADLAAVDAKIEEHSIISEAFADIQESEEGKTSIFIMCVKACIKNYRKEAGQFLPYCLTAIKREVKRRVEKIKDGDRTGGITGRSPYHERLIHKLHKYLESKENNSPILEIREIMQGDIEWLAPIIGVKPKTLTAAIVEDRNCYVMSDRVTATNGDEEEESSLFDTVESSELNQEDRWVQEDELKARKTQIAVIAEVFDKLEEGKKAMFRDRITLALIKDLLKSHKDDKDYTVIDDIKEYEGYPFYSADVVEQYQILGKITNRTICAWHGVSEQDLKGKYDRFTKVAEQELKKLKRG